MINEKKFKVSDLFDVQTSKSIDKNKLNLNTDNKGYQYIGRTIFNNGIQGYINELDFKSNPKDTFSVSQIGQINVQFRESEWYASQNMFILAPLKASEKIIKTKLYFLASINKSLSIFRGGYSSYPTKQTLSDLNFYLPITKSDEIDFEYMTARIRELEEARIRELDMYLEITGLSDYSLSKEEEAILEKYRMGGIQTSPFKIGDLFEIYSTRSFNKDRLTPVTNKKFAYVTRTSENNGILQYTGFVNSENLNRSGTFSLGLLQMDFFYQKTDWYAGQFVRKIVPKFKMNESTALYFQVIFNAMKPLLLGGLVRDVDEKFTEHTVYLPSDKSRNPNFEFMEQFIEIQKKLAVKKLMEWRGRQIEVTKQVIAQ